MESLLSDNKPQPFRVFDLPIDTPLEGQGVYQLQSPPDSDPNRSYLAKITLGNDGIPLRVIQEMNRTLGDAGNGRYQMHYDFSYHRSPRLFEQLLTVHSIQESPNVDQVSFWYEISAEGTDFLGIVDLKTEHSLELPHSSVGKIIFRPNVVVYFSINSLWIATISDELRTLQRHSISYSFSNNRQYAMPSFNVAVGNISFQLGVRREVLPDYEKYILGPKEVVITGAFSRVILIEQSSLN